MTFLRATAFAVSAALLAASPAAFAQTVTATDFATRATVSNTFEIESSRLALQKSQKAEVKAFAQQMITDHTKAGTEMQAALAADQITAPPAALDAPHQQKLQKLQGASGAAFDDAYVAEQKLAHDEAVTLFSTYAQGGEPGALKTFAAKTLPTLKQHQDHVKHLHHKQ